MAAETEEKPFIQEGMEGYVQVWDPTKNAWVFMKDIEQMPPVSLETPESTVGKDEAAFAEGEESEADREFYAMCAADDAARIEQAKARQSG